MTNDPAGIQGARRRSRPVRIWLSAVLLACFSGAFGESSDQEIRDDLESVRARLEATARELAQAREEHDTHTRALARSERLAADIRGEIDGIEGRLAEAERRADEARRAGDRTRTELAERRLQLGRAVRASYRFARRDPLAVLLDAESLHEIDRILAYHALVERAHTAKIRAVVAAVSRLEEHETSVAKEVAAIAALGDEKRHRLAELEDQRAIRADAIEALADRIRDGKSRAARLRADESRLVELIEALQASLTDAALAIRDNRRFEELRGQLPWPVRGALLASYGGPRGESGLTWQGVMIGARAGEAVRSVHRGRVAYADWLRGFGLLLIVEHDGGFMSLYGHNQTLNKETGDWVESGEIIATVGDSGGNARPALYFEIRQAGRPVNPRRWCAGPTTAALGSIVAARL